jgi:acetyl esterase/lipase
VSYHLAKTGPGDPSVDGFPLPLQDVKAAIRFLRANASDYHLDPKRIGICGESAGGHLALLAALTQPKDGLDGEVPAGAPSSEVQAVANIFGPTDLTALAEDNPVTKPGLVILMGAVPELMPEAYKKASPVTYARRDAPPILTIHGSADSLVPVSQAKRLDAALKRTGAKHTLLILHGAGHGFWGDNATRSGQAVYGFFEKTLKP